MNTTVTGNGANEEPKGEDTAYDDIVVQYAASSSDSDSEESDSGVSSTRRAFVPPINFAMVAPGVYRSGFPNPRNLSFLRVLHLRTVVNIGTDSYSENLMSFFDERGITVLEFPLKGNKEPFTEIDGATMAMSLRVVLDQRNHPVLVHCTKGKHRVGCFCGIIRKLQRWSLVSIFDEYRRLAGQKTRLLDQQFIELYDVPDSVWPEEEEHAPQWLLRWTSDSLLDDAENNHYGASKPREGVTRFRSDGRSRRATVIDLEDEEGNIPLVFD
eukprot:Clim_evm30s202 gene=Clim_evmTU30s202